MITSQTSADIALAVRHIDDVLREPNQNVARDYGRLTHQVARLLRRHPLVQVVGFIDQQAEGPPTGSDVIAAKRVKMHLAEVVGVTPDQTLAHVRSSSTIRDLFDTRRAIEGWEAHVRYVTVLLDVSADEEMA